MYLIDYVTAPSPSRRSTRPPIQSSPHDDSTILSSDEPINPARCRTSEHMSITGAEWRLTRDAAKDAMQERRGVDASVGGEQSA